MNGPRVYDDPSEVTAEHGEVMVDGPDGVSVSLTPEAAEEIARRLLAAAKQARAQRDHAQDEGAAG